MYIPNDEDAVLVIPRDAFDPVSPAPSSLSISVKKDKPAKVLIGRIVIFPSVEMPQLLNISWAVARSVEEK
jgi:hypothetical protein